PGGELAGGVLYPTNAFSVMIGFVAQTSGTYNGEAHITVHNPARPAATLPIHALSHPGCLGAAPGPLRFGPVRPHCRASTLSTYVSNQCPSTTVINRIEIGPGTSEQFLLPNPPPVPVTLAPGAGVDVAVGYAQRILGQHFSPLWFYPAGE